MPRLPQLDGWRAISILLVLVTHMVPLGPRSLQLGETTGVLGMSLFFCLSGFLIATTLLYRPSLREFVVRRFCRILPLAWLYLLIVLPLLEAPRDLYPPHFFFYLNQPPWPMTPYTDHYWSLCVEMQFYALVAIVFMVLRRNGLVLFPFLGIAVTLARIWHHSTAEITTFYRIDELFAGVTLALIHQGMLGKRLGVLLPRANPYVIFGLLALSANPHFVYLNYFRPYLAATVVGITVFDGSRWQWLKSRSLGYIATISYALYIIHPAVLHGWFDPANKLLKYARRPIGLAITFSLAHLSTFHYEKWWIGFGKKLSRTQTILAVKAAPDPGGGVAARHATSEVSENQPIP